MGGGASDELSVLVDVAARLDGAGIAYMLSGSMALSFYAEPRLTRDIDIVLEIAPGDAERIEALFVDDFLCDVDAVRDAARRGGMFNIIHSERIVKVDFIVRKALPFRQQEFDRRRRVVVQGVAVSIVTPEDLLLSKLDWAKDSRSEVQLRDVRSLITALPDLDWAYIEHWAAVLSVGELLAEVRA